MVIKLKNIIKKTENELIRNDLQYFKEFEPLLTSDFWTLPQMWTETNPGFVYSTSRDKECFNEKISDRCMTLLLGTWEHSAVPCVVTHTCRNTMTQFGCPDYSLSHQLLYFMIGELKRCPIIPKREQEQPRVSMTTQDYKQVFCSNMMKKNLVIEKEEFPLELRDLFMEYSELAGDLYLGN
nr:PREDICTED: UPF0764 protein C16orf89 homolog [Latimeria chalumnae]|eukprot:XP_014339728.1 PREDICTED: UPF0764 protein C16orf89 homolog [Latimeria chalumnae]